jgi:Flp pilus assembly protein TadD
VLGAVYGQTARTEESLNAHRNAVRLSPTDHEAHSNLANTLLDLGRLEEAEANCRIAVKLCPKFAVAHSNLGSILTELRSLDEAEISFRRAITLEGDMANARVGLGRVLLEKGHHKCGLRQLAKGHGTILFGIECWDVYPIGSQDV